MDNEILIYIFKLIFAMVAAYGIGRMIRLVWDYFGEDKA